VLLVVRQWPARWAAAQQRLKQLQQGGQDHHVAAGFWLMGQGRGWGQLPGCDIHSALMHDLFKFTCNLHLKCIAAGAAGPFCTSTATKLCSSLGCFAQFHHTRLLSN
jgi:hypothetical protein